MKTLGFIVLIAGAAVAGWFALSSYQKGKVADANPTAQPSTNAIARDEGMARRAANAEILGSTRRAVEAFKSQEGRNPQSLDEVVAKGFLDRVPVGVTYDAATGTVDARQ